MIKENGKQERLPIMPNHVRLAEQFAISDNFYMEPQASGDGIDGWLAFIRVLGLRGSSIRMGFKRAIPPRDVSFRSHRNGSQIPEDYLENGSMWEHLHRGGIPFRNYGKDSNCQTTTKAP